MKTVKACLKAGRHTH